jgi:D-tyrosyl-tRNA(Tyr) deacylase
MRLVLQRVSHASVRVDGQIVGAIEAGFVALTGIADGDGEAEADAMAAKLAGLRLFSDADGKFNLALSDVGGAVLVVSQFTLIADLRKGRRPSFLGAARPEIAELLVDRFADQLSRAGVPVERGCFGAHMEVELLNDGPVTLVIDSADLERLRRACPPRPRSSGPTSS